MAERRDVLAVTVLLASSLWSIGHTSYKQWKDFKSAARPYELAELGEEVEAFKKAGATQDRIGFLSSAPDSDSATMDIMTLQYEFVPSLVVRSIDPEFVVAHIHNPKDGQDFAITHHLILVLAESDGFLLLKHPEHR